MNVRTLIRFNDLKENKIREVNDEFEASKERVEQINSTLSGALVEAIETEKEVIKEKPIQLKNKPIKKSR